jgi:hypothetical protein
MFNRDREAKYEGKKDENGQYHGKGKILYSDGSTYVGEFKHGKKHG